MSDLLLTFLCGLLGGVLGSLAHKWGLERKVSQLEIECYDLKERLLIEIKKRASAAGKKHKEFEQEALDLVKAPAAPSAPPMWWAPFVSADKRG